ncbi:MAG: TonB-dependent receptor [candidate division Zixibacteria bacterium]|nr:TonB-dependent receptor [candidate division Zixibacteria bacterium]
MKHSCIFLALFVIAAACPDLYAQRLLVGQVIDQNKQPISHVTVQSAQIETRVQTDTVGTFWVKRTVPEPVSITLSHAGFIPRTIRVEADADTVTVIMTEQIYPMEGITVTAGRAVERQTPVPFTTIDRAEIQKDHDIGEIPALLETTPNVYAYSDAGGGLGYSYLKIRGFDGRRVPVYINGIPLNDPEDHSLYFIDLPDFAATVDNIQVQRGVGNSLYGDAAFGGTVNMLTSPLSQTRRFEAEFGYGGCLQGDPTVGLMRKHSVAYATGLLDGGWSLSGRWVDQYSGGYREKSWYDGTAYYLSVGRVDPRMITTLNMYAGPMRTHAAWDGITRETEAVNRRANGYTYDNETDNFNQPHFELHNIFNLTDKITLYNTLYHIRGSGYYEQLQYGENLSGYNLTDDPDLQSDLIRRKWVNKGQWGMTSQTVIEDGGNRTAFGGSYYFFQSRHWGEVLWVKDFEPSLPEITPHKYYEHFGKYHDFSLYGVRVQKIGDRLTLSGNLQMRYQHIAVHQTPMGQFARTIYGFHWLFLSPRLGATYAVTDRLSAFAGFSIASHEPNDDMIDDTDDPSDQPRLEIVGHEDERTIYGDPTVEPERVYDFELGTTYRASNLSGDINLFWMEYRNEIVPDGGLNNDGFPTYGNSARSVHRGIETSLSWKVRPGLKIDANYPLNDNWIKEYDQIVYDWNDGTSSVVKRRNVAVPQFPTWLANLGVTYTFRRAELVYRLRGVGRLFPYLDGRFTQHNGRGEDVSIKPYTVSSLKAIIRLGAIFGGADLTLEGRVDNLFDQKFETFGYYASWYDQYLYWPGAERNWYMTLKMAI